MVICPKCHTGNEEGLTRCRACNAILPVKLGSKSTTRWERVRRQPDLVGLNCPKCGAINPYTRFKCKDCGTSLVQTQTNSDITRIWIYVGIGVVIAVLTIVFGFRGV
jgi:ribosomal protein L40E